MDAAQGVGEKAHRPDRYSTKQRSMPVKMGDKSKAFCCKTVEVPDNNVGILPANFNLSEELHDPTAFVPCA